VLRHSFASLAHDLGYSEPTIAAIVGHKGHTITSRYVHGTDAVLLAAADAVADRTTALMTVAAGGGLTGEIEDSPTIEEGRGGGADPSKIGMGLGLPVTRNLQFFLESPVISCWGTGRIQKSDRHSTQPGGPARMAIRSRRGRKARSAHRHRRMGKATNTKPAAWARQSSSAVGLAPTRTLIGAGVSPDSLAAHTAQECHARAVEACYRMATLRRRTRDPADPLSGRLLFLDPKARKSAAPSPYWRVRKSIAPPAAQLEKLLTLQDR
jgi:hypothetical protein